MRKKDLTVPSLLLEAVDIVLLFIYIGLQIYYTITFSIPPYKMILNMLIMLLVYAGFTVLSIFPERLNHIPVEVCTGRIRKYSLRMIRLVKFVFILGLLIPCVFDALRIRINNAYSLIIIGMILVIAVFYEYRIIKEFKELKK